MNNEVLIEIFKKSAKQKGYIYLAKKKDIFKYGKTKNIQKRMKMYGSDYSLLNKYKVNHLSLREELIRYDNEITSDRHEEGNDARDEHHNFDISSIVEFYAKCNIILEPYSVNKREDIIICKLEDDECIRSLTFILKTIHF